MLLCSNKTGKITARFIPTLWSALRVLQFRTTFHLCFDAYEAV